MNAIILLFSSLLITAQAKFNFTQFTKGFNIHFENDEQLKSLVKHGFECLHNGFQLIDSFIDGSQEPQQLDIYSFLQEAKTFNEVAQCFSTLQTLATLVGEHINTTFIQSNFERSYPAIIQRLQYFVNEWAFAESETFGTHVFFGLQSIFFTGGYETKFLVNPSQTVDFDLSRFYAEFFPGFFEKLFGKNSKASQEMTKCLNKTHFIIADLGQRGQSVEDQLLGFAIRAPELMEELQECVRSSNNTMLSFSLFGQAVKNEPMVFLNNFRKSTISRATALQRNYGKGVEKILEGKYDEAGASFAKMFREALARYSLFFQSELAYMVENGLINPLKSFD